LHLRAALHVTRLANANWVRKGNTGMRYIVDAPIHEALPPEVTLGIKDVVDGSTLTVYDLLGRLPTDLQKQVCWTYCRLT